MGKAKEFEIEIANRRLNAEMSWSLKRLGFNYPVLCAYDACMHLEESDGTYFYMNKYGGQASCPTYGLAVHFLKEEFDINFQLYHSINDPAKHQAWKERFLKTLNDLKPSKQKKEKRNYKHLNDALNHGKTQALKEIKDIDKALKVLKDLKISK